ncbi:hypothetical protein I3760_05G160500 [Carya illinoinensis]|nr:hypothetical protein I3760_05G160500 [Carya illinoinensis]
MTQFPNSDCPIYKNPSFSSSFSHSPFVPSQSLAIVSCSFIIKNFMGLYKRKVDLVFRGLNGWKVFEKRLK